MGGAVSLKYTSTTNYTMLQFGQFKLHIIRECKFALDGGAMFGVVPYPLWSKVSPPDELNRIQLACNLLLIETPHGIVLVEAGMGNRWTEKERERWQLQSLVDSVQSLRSVGFENSNVDAVVLSHLHFDHAGGATILSDGDLVPTYPLAKYYVQKGEWDFAHEANARARASYRQDDYEPLAEHGVLQLIEGDYEIMPGVTAKVSGGHTSHHQVVVFESGGKKGVYFADLMPTSAHISPPWTMGYDHYPLQCCDVKSAFLSEIVRDNWLVVFDHEVNVPWGYVQRDDKGKYEFLPLPEETMQAGSLLSI